MNDDFAPSDPSFDRRALLKAAAWTTPVLLLAAPAPAAAASGGATGQLSFTNVNYYWSYGDGGVIGLAANTTVGFDEGGTGTLTTIALVIRIENADGQYLVGGVPIILLGAPAWTASGPGVAIDVGGVAWIRVHLRLGGHARLHRLHRSHRGRRSTDGASSVPACGERVVDDRVGAWEPWRTACARKRHGIRVRGPRASRSLRSGRGVTRGSIRQRDREWSNRAKRKRMHARRDLTPLRSSPPPR